MIICIWMMRVIGTSHNSIFCKYIWKWAFQRMFASNWDSIVSKWNCDHCFEGCTALTNVYIPSSITFIRELIFIGCTSLTGVSIPSSYKKLFLSRYLGIDKKKVNLKKNYKHHIFTNKQMLNYINSSFNSIINSRYLGIDK